MKFSNQFATLIFSSLILHGLAPSAARADDEPSNCDRLLRIQERIPGLYESIPATHEILIGPHHLVTSQVSRYEFSTTFNVLRKPRRIDAGFIRIWKSVLKDWLRDLVRASGTYQSLDASKAENYALDTLRFFSKTVPGLSELEAIAFLMEKRFTSPEIVSILKSLEDLRAIETFFRDLKRNPEKILATDFTLHPELMKVVKREFQDLTSVALMDLLAREALLQTPYQARVVRKISDSHIEFESAFFDRDADGGIPKILNDPDTVPMIPEKGTPTLTYITLHQMRLAGIQSGQLSTATVTDIKNVRTGLEMANHPKVREWHRTHPNQPVDDQILKEVFLQSQTGRYVETILHQSGHLIDSIDFIETPPRLPPSFVPVSLSEMPRDAQALLARLNREKHKTGEPVLIYYHFNIQIGLKPSH